ncbi:uncharacterized protein LOC141853650 [Brevipalpus obovatus]|uniref:uncharacterized protein LOC141853650 n=1 Tax=Brevipalpus obovatus TaxID=246614 RepID=UPI003D9E8899
MMASRPNRTCHHHHSHQTRCTGHHHNKHLQESHRASKCSPPIGSSSHRLSFKGNSHSRHAKSSPPPGHHHGYSPPTRSNGSSRGSSGNSQDSVNSGSSDTDNSANRFTSSSEHSFNTVIYCGDLSYNQSSQNKLAIQSHHLDTTSSNITENGGGLTGSAGRVDRTASMRLENGENKRQSSDELYRKVSSSCNPNVVHEIYVGKTIEIGRKENANDDQTFRDIGTSPYHQCNFSSSSSSPKNHAIRIDGGRHSIRRRQSRRSCTRSEELWVDGPNMCPKLSNKHECHLNVTRVCMDKQQRVNEWILKQSNGSESLEETKCLDKPMDSCLMIHFDSKASKSSHSTVNHDNLQLPVSSEPENISKMDTIKTNEMACQTEFSDAINSGSPANCQHHQQVYHVDHNPNLVPSSVECLLVNPSTCANIILTSHNRNSCVTNHEFEDPSNIDETTNVERRFNLENSSHQLIEQQVKAAVFDGEKISTDSTTPITSVSNDNSNSVKPINKPPQQLKLEQFLCQLNILTNPHSQSTDKLSYDDDHRKLPSDVPQEIVSPSHELKKINTRSNCNTNDSSVPLQLPSTECSLEEDPKSAQFVSCNVNSLPNSHCSYDNFLIKSAHTQNEVPQEDHKGSILTFISKDIEKCLGKSMVTEMRPDETYRSSIAEMSDSLDRLVIVTKVQQQELQNSSSTKRITGNDVVHKAPETYISTGKYGENRAGSQPPSSGYDSTILDDSEDEKIIQNQPKSHSVRNHIPDDGEIYGKKHRSKKKVDNSADVREEKVTDSDLCSFFCFSFMRSK